MVYEAVRMLLREKQLILERCGRGMVSFVHQKAPRFIGGIKRRASCLRPRYFLPYSHHINWPVSLFGCISVSSAAVCDCPVLKLSVNASIRSNNHTSSWIKRISISFRFLTFVRSDRGNSYPSAASQHNSQYIWLWVTRVVPRVFRQRTAWA